MASVDFFFDCSSPGTYVAFHRLLLLQREHSFAIAWRPIFIGGIFKAVNPRVFDARANMPPIKAAYFILPTGRGTRSSQSAGRSLSTRRRWFDMIKQRPAVRCAIALGMDWNLERHEMTDAERRTAFEQSAKTVAAARAKLKD